MGVSFFLTDKIVYFKSQIICNAGGKNQNKVYLWFELETFILSIFSTLS